MGLYTPPLFLLEPLTATVSSGGTSAAIDLGDKCEFIRVDRDPASTGTLKFVLGAGTAASGYPLTADDPSTGMMPCSDRTATVYADTGDVVYRIWRWARTGNT